MTSVMTEWLPVITVVVAWKIQIEVFTFCASKVRTDQAVVDKVLEQYMPGYSVSPDRSTAERVVVQAAPEAELYAIARSAAH